MIHKVLPDIVTSNLYNLAICATSNYSFSLNVIVSSTSIFCREGNGSPLQYSCLESPMVRGAWQAILHGVIKRLTQFKD